MVSLMSHSNHLSSSILNDSSISTNNKSSTILNGKETIYTRIRDDVMQQKLRCEKHIKIEEFASSLIKDPNLDAVLAKAVAQTIASQQSKRQGPNLNLNLLE
ncbi:hypothetical protein RYX36_022418 [Vicia faba]